MRRFLRVSAIVLIALVLISAVLIYGFLHRWHIKKHTPDELASLLKPYMQIRKPEGNGPFPTIIGFHAGHIMRNEAGRIPKGYEDWADYLAGLGYATILVDSFSPRGILTQDDIASTRFTLWGSERAGDVLVSLEEARKLSYVDVNQLALFGWSNGAWAIMDLFVMDPPNALPTNLKTSTDQSLAGVKAAVLFYPYCNFPAKSRSHGWFQDIEVLMLMGGRDRVTEACLEIATILKDNDQPVSTQVYPTAGHSFDAAYEELPNSHNPEATSDARERVKKFLAQIFSK